MPSTISTAASEHYISFLVAMGDDEPLGCHLPRSDACFLAENLQGLIEQKASEDDFPEIEYETESMEVSGMSTGDVIMLSFGNKISGRRVQIAIDNDTSRLLIQSIQKAEESNQKVNGPDQTSKSSAWKFFELKKAS
jgi:hypothetical protein